MQKPIAHRGPASGTKGMAASAHTLITASGIRVLENGGNACDAALAMAFVSAVVLPDMCGLGGDVFALYYDAETGKITAVNSSGPLPRNASVRKLKEAGASVPLSDGIHSVTVPGAVDAYYAMAEKWGSLPVRELMDDAIRLCDEGFPLSAKVVRHMHTDLSRMKQYPGLAAMYLKDGKPYEAYERFRNPDLASMLRYLQENGRDGFYHGLIRDRILACSEENGGFFAPADFEGSFCEFRDPISVSYRGMRVWQTPPVSQGIIHLEELGILSHFDPGSYGYGSAESIHLMEQAKRIAFSDRRKYFGDPAFVSNPVKEVLDENYTKRMAQQIRMDSCLGPESFLDHQPGDTTSFVCVDEKGNAVSFIHSIANTWGSCLIPEGTGFLLNNRAAGFFFAEGHPNVYAPGKRTMHTLNTWLITEEDGTLRYVGNTPGGDNQPQWNMQTVVNLLDFGMDVQQALEHAKWTGIEKNGRHILRIEEQAGEETLQQLRKMGHELEVIPPFACSGASQLIEIRKDGVRLGGSDPRGDGCAMPQI